MSAAWRSLLRLSALLLLGVLSLQLYFLCRVALMLAIDPASTTFQRSEAWRLLTQQHTLPWRHEWVGYGQISAHLKRAVIASEDAGFAEHSGVEWDALEKAWERNQKAIAQAEKSSAAQARRAPRTRADGAVPARTPERPPERAAPRLVGGSTITQQLAKNLFLGGERSLLRKTQEFAITFMLEGLLTKSRILEIYLNHVEWGEGVFGAQAAAHHYFRSPASALGPLQAAQLAVMLPAPKRFEKRPGSPYLMGRAATVSARMGGVELP